MAKRKKEVKAMRNFRIVYTIEKNNKSYQESFFCKTMDNCKALIELYKNKGFRFTKFDIK